ncbi:MAG: hypothetical protein U0326_36395 [Polyangiales bacterium]
MKTPLRIEDPSLAELVGRVVAYGGLYDGPDPYGSFERVAAFTELVARFDAAVVTSLLAHESPVLRGYIARHLLRDRRPALELFEPLLLDDREFDTLTGCLADRITLGELLCNEIGLLSSRYGPLRREPEPTRSEAMLCFLERAARDSSLSVDVRGCALENLGSSEATRALPLIRAGIESEHPAIVCGALAGMRLLPLDELEAALPRLLEHPHPSVRFDALYAADAREVGDLETLLERVAANDPDRGVKSAASQLRSTLDARRRRKRKRAAFLSSLPD